MNNCHIASECGYPDLHDHFMRITILKTSVAIRQISKSVSGQRLSITIICLMIDNLFVGILLRPDYWLSLLGKCEIT